MTIASPDILCRETPHQRHYEMQLANYMRFGKEIARSLMGMILWQQHSATTQRCAHLSKGPVHEFANRAAATIAAQLEGNITPRATIRGVP